VHYNQMRFLPPVYPAQIPFALGRVRACPKERMFSTHATLRGSCDARVLHRGSISTSGLQDFLAPVDLLAETIVPTKIVKCIVEGAAHGRQRLDLGQRAIQIL
jgi:hypothetical protein